VLLIYYLLLFNVVNFPGNSFTNGLTMGIAEIAAMIISGIVLQYVEGLIAFKVFLVITLVGALSLTMVTNVYAVMALILFAVLGGGGCYNIIFIVHEERTPTEIMGASLEVSMSIARVFVAMVPQIAMMEAPLPMTILSGIVIGTFLVTFSVTTQAKHIPIELLDENYKEENSFHSGGEEHSKSYFHHTRDDEKSEFYGTSFFHR